MFLRFKNAGRIGVVGSLVLLACSSTPPAGGGNGGSSGSGGSATAGSSNAGSGTTGGGGSGTAGSSTTAGSGGAGMTSGGAGASTGGNGGASAGSGGANGGSGGANGGSGGAGGKSKTTFFVTSDTSKTGKLGGLTGADMRCQTLAKAAGIGDHTFHAYLSTENPAVNAKDRIGAGPWTNAKGIKVADSVAALHAPAMKGDPTLFIDEKGMPIHGQWDSSATVEHDILTGSKADGTVAAGKTCMDWTSDAANIAATVGHSDGMGPGMATTGNYPSWNSSHDNMSCADTAPRGGAGRLYCFAID
jgi:hypothetical protein